MSPSRSASGPPYSYGRSTIARSVHLLGGSVGRPIVVRAGSDVHSEDFVTGSAGWWIGGNGNVEFNNGTFRGTIEASAIHIPDQVTTDSFHVDAAGRMWMGSDASSYSAAEFTIDADGTVYIGPKTGNHIQMFEDGTFGTAVRFISGEADETQSGLLYMQTVPDSAEFLSTIQLRPGYFNANPDVSPVISMTGTNEFETTASYALLQSSRVQVFADFNDLVDVFSNQFAIRNGSSAVGTYAYGDNLYSFHSDGLHMERDGVGRIAFFSKLSYTSLSQQRDAIAGDTYTSDGLWLYSDNVGSIGTDGGELFIAGDRVYFSRALGGSSDDYIDHDGTDISFVIAGTEDFRIDSSGYAHVGGRRIYFGVGSNDYIEFNDSTDVYSFWADATEQLRIDDGRIYSASASINLNGISSDDRLYLDDDEFRVYMGGTVYMELDTSSSGRLRIGGDLLAFGNTASNEAYLQFGDHGADTAYARIVVQDAGGTDEIFRVTHNSGYGQLSNIDEVQCEYGGAGDPQFTTRLANTTGWYVESALNGGFAAGATKALDISNVLGTIGFLLGDGGSAGTLASGAGTNDLRYNTGTGAVTYQVSNRWAKKNIAPHELLDQPWGQLPEMGRRFKWKAKWAGPDRSYQFGAIAEDIHDLAPMLAEHDAEGRPAGVDTTAIAMALWDRQARFERWVVDQLDLAA